MKEKMKQSVSKLSEQVANMEAGSAIDKSEMAQLVDDLHHHLEHPEDKEHLKGLTEKIPEFIAKLEVEHPGIAETLNEIMVILSNMGI